MIRFLAHPAFERLSRYADGELEGDRRDRVASHLADCDRCRDTIRFIRELGEAARHLPEPEPPADALSRFLARRAAGERVILPTCDSVPIEIERKRALPAIAAMLTLFIAGTLLVSVPRLRADRSRLEFAPDRPRAGEIVRVEYESGALLRSEATLVLRGRFRYANGNFEILELGELIRGGDGLFHGTISLPDSVVYAVVAVEDTAASRVDSHTRRLWELVVHGRDGRPLFEALRERTNDLFYRNWELAYETARTLTRLYPDRAWGWHTLFSFEKALVQGAARDSLVRANRERLRELDRLFRQVEPGADDAAFLAIYALVLDEMGVHRHWRDHLLRAAPRHAVSVQFKMFDVHAGGRADAILAGLERLWNDAGARHRELAIAGFHTALRVGDVDPVYRWADRYLDVAPEQAAVIARFLAASVDKDARLVGWLGAARRHVSSAVHHPRALYQDNAWYAEDRAEDEASIQTILAGSLLTIGKTGEGLDLLMQAAEVGWNLTAFRTAAQALADRGQTERATEYLARIAIDPAADPALVDWAATLGREWMGDSLWQSAMRRARATLSVYVNRHAVRRRLPAGVALMDAAGAVTRLGDLLNGEVTLVAFWSPLSAPAVAALPELEETARRLDKLEIRTVSIYLGPVSPDAAHMAVERIPSVSTFFDPRREVATAFEQWGTPEFFVVDRAGIARSQYTSLEAAVRQAAVLTSPEADRRLVAP